VSNIQVTADVTGTVWKVLVKVGDTVQADDTLLIIESMKMEIPLAAPSAGRVVSVLAAEGEAIQEDQALVVLASL
jgi:acetyl-CoA carboxylase biotin carboxyl carrier protein